MQFLMQHNYSSSLSRTMICFLSLTLIACGGNYEEQSQQASVHAGPPELPLAIENSARLSGSYNHSLALSTNGNVFSWGANGDGQLGNNSANDSRIPVLVMGLSAVKVVQTGETHSTVLHNNGSVWSWGSNRYGQMGLSTVTSSRLPMQVSGISGVKSIASGQNHVVAVKTDGTVWGWGKTISTATNLPQMMNGFSSVKAVSAGSDFSVALKNDGTVWAWGNNSFGTFGIHDKIQLQFFMRMQRKIELRFGPAKDGKTISAGKGGDLPHDICCHNR